MDVSLLESGGFDCDFVEKPHDRLVCKICHSPCRKAQLTTCCGQIFCESDLKKLKGSTTIEKRCPICRSNDFNAYPQLEADREINALQVYCPNKELGRGCRWKVELANLVNHLSSCKVGCDKCGEVLPHKTYQMHIQNDCPCYCPYCKITAESDVISNEHKEKCIMFPISCPNTCGAENIPQGDVAKHRETCPLEVVWCEYHDMGCDVRLARNDMMQHHQERMADHLRFVSSITKKQTIALYDSKKILEVSVLEVSERVSNLLSNQAVQEEATEKLTKEVAAVKEKNAKVKHTNFLVRNVFHNSLSILLIMIIVALVLYYEQQLSSLKIHVSHLETKNHSHLQQESLKSFLLNSMNNSNKELEQKIAASLAYPINHATSIGLTLSRMTNIVYKHTTSNIWKLQLFNEMMLHGNNVAPVILTFDNFTQKLSENQVWYSTPFLAFDKGYQMSLNVLAAGFGEAKGTHLSALLYLMKGPHDDELQKLGYFSKTKKKGSFKVELLNQLHNRGHRAMIVDSNDECHDVLVTRVTTEKKPSGGCGSLQFISHYELIKSKDSPDLY